MGRNEKSLVGIPWEWELVTKLEMGMERNANWLHENGRKWECKKPFPVISITAFSIDNENLCHRGHFISSIHQNPFI